MPYNKRMKVCSCEEENCYFTSYCLNNETATISRDSCIIFSNYIALDYYLRKKYFYLFLLCSTCRWHKRLPEHVQSFVKNNSQSRIYVQNEVFRYCLCFTTRHIGNIRIHCAFCFFRLEICFQWHWGAILSYIDNCRFPFVRMFLRCGMTYF